MSRLPLADYFKKATWDSHREAETTGLINDILRGTASVESYALFLHNLHPVYQAMESSQNWLDSFPEMRAYFGKALFRTQAIKHDLKELTLLTGLMPPPLISPTQDYLAHVENALNKNHTLCSPIFMYATWAISMADLS